MLAPVFDIGVEPAASSQTPGPVDGAPKIPSPSMRLPFHFPRGARLVSRWPCLLSHRSGGRGCLCVEPRGPVSPIGVLDIQMTAVMRREFGTTEPPSSEVKPGRGRANCLVHVHFLPPVGRSLLTKTCARGRLPFSSHASVA